MRCVCDAVMVTMVVHAARGGAYVGIKWTSCFVVCFVPRITCRLVELRHSWLLLLRSDGAASHQVLQAGSYRYSRYLNHSSAGDITPRPAPVVAARAGAIACAICHAEITGLSPDQI